MNFDKYINPLPYASHKKNPTANFDFRVMQTELEYTFKHDLFKELGIEDHPKRDVFFAKVWALGHPAGYAEVYHYALDLVELIQD